MKLSATLSLAAAALLPALAQQSLSPSSLPAPSGLSAPPSHAAPATPEQRARVFDALALLPSDVGDFVTVSNVGHNLMRLLYHSSSPKLSVDDIPYELRKIDDVAIASSSANKVSYAALASILVDYYTLREMEILISEGLADAHEHADFAFRMEAARRGLSMMGNLDKLLSEARLHPIYGVVTCKPGYDGLLQDLYFQILNEMQQLSRGCPGCEIVHELNGFTGLRIDVRKLEISGDFSLRNAFRYILGKGPRRSPSGIFSDVVEQDVAGRSVYILIRQEGNAFVGAICEDPSELKLASCPAESVLATEAAAQADGQLHPGVFGMACLSNELLASTGAFTAEHADTLGEAVAGLFNRLARRDTDNRKIYDRAADGARSLASLFSPVLARGNQPLTALCWLDRNLNFRLGADAMGFEFEQAPLRHRERLKAKHTALYAASTPWRTPAALPTASRLADASLALAGGVRQALAPQGRRFWDKNLLKYETEIRLGANMITNFARTFDGSFAFLMDAQDAYLPPVLGGDEGLRFRMPRVAASFGVRDAQALSKRWLGLVYASNVLSFHADPHTPFFATEPNKYAPGDCFRLRYVNSNCVFTTLLRDSSLLAGNCIRLNDELMQTSTGTSPVAGAVLSLDFEPLEQSLRRFGQVSGYYYACRDMADFMEACSVLGTGFYAAASTEDGRFILNASLLLR